MLKAKNKRGRRQTKSERRRSTQSEFLRTEICSRNRVERGQPHGNAEWISKENRTREKRKGGLPTLGGLKGHGGGQSRKGGLCGWVGGGGGSRANQSNARVRKRKGAGYAVHAEQEKEQKTIRGGSFQRGLSFFFGAAKGGKGKKATGRRGEENHL